MEKELNRICLIAIEIFAWGKHGGYGKTTRIIGRELVRRGYEVHAVVPRRAGQKALEMLDGMTVHSYPVKGFLWSGSIYKKINAQLYFSLEPNTGTAIAMKAVPKAIHLISVQNPKFTREWIQEWIHPSQSRWQVMKNYLFENNYFVRRAVWKADGLFVPAHYLIGKVKKRYHLSKVVEFLPAPVEMPGEVNKAEMPIVLFMGRFDMIKRPEIGLELAQYFPQVRFKFAGKSRNETYNQYLKRQYAAFSNVEFLGFVDQFQGDLHHRLYSEAWIHLNTSVREGLPNSFIEAAGHRCAILSSVNPDGFASSYGYHVTDGNFREGLRWLLEDQRWKEKGRQGYQYVSVHYELNSAIDAHEDAFIKAFETHKK